MILTIKHLGMYIAAVALVFASSFTQAALADQPANDDPQPLLADTINQLIDRLQESATEIRNDSSVAYRISDELVAPRIDFPRITRLVIGKHWRSASKSQQQRLINEVQTLLVRSYVTAMTSYVDQIVASRNHIKFLPSRYKPGDRKASVKVSITLETGMSVDVQYQLYNNSGAWKIYDIHIEGISLAITYRTSFGETITNEGLESLIAQLEERNRKGEVELPSSIAKPFSENPAQ